MPDRRRSKGRGAPVGRIAIRLTTRGGVAQEAVYELRVGRRVVRGSWSDESESEAAIHALADLVIALAREGRSP